MLIQTVSTELWSKCWLQGRVFHSGITLLSLPPLPVSPRPLHHAWQHVLTCTSTRETLLLCFNTPDKIIKEETKHLFAQPPLLLSCEFTTSVAPFILTVNKAWLDSSWSLEPLGAKICNIFKPVLCVHWMVNSIVNQQQQRHYQCMHFSDHKNHVCLFWCAVKLRWGMRTIDCLWQGFKVPLHCML